MRGGIVILGLDPRIRCSAGHTNRPPNHSLDVAAALTRPALYPFVLTRILIRKPNTLIGNTL